MVGSFQHVRLNTDMFLSRGMIVRFTIFFYYLTRRISLKIFLYGFRRFVRLPWFHNRYKYIKVLYVTLFNYRPWYITRSRLYLHLYSVSNPKELRTLLSDPTPYIQKYWCCSHFCWRRRLFWTLGAPGVREYY